MSTTSFAGTATINRKGAAQDADYTLSYLHCRGMSRFATKMSDEGTKVRSTFFGPFGNQLLRVSAGRGMKSGQYIRISRNFALGEGPQCTCGLVAKMTMILLCVLLVAFFTLSSCSGDHVSASYPDSRPVRRPIPWPCE